MSSSLQFVNSALIKCGADVIQSFDDNSPSAKIAKNLYETTRDSLLCLYNWRFATKLFALNLVDNMADNLPNNSVITTSYHYILPQNFLRAISVSTAEDYHQTEKFDIIGDQLVCAVNPAYLLAIYRPLETQFPAYFGRLLINYLASEFCIPLTEDINKTKLFLSQFQNDIKNARMLDGQTQPFHAVQSFPLCEARQ